MSLRSIVAKSGGWPASISRGLQYAFYDFTRGDAADQAHHYMGCDPGPGIRDLCPGDSLFRMADHVARPPVRVYRWHSAVLLGLHANERVAGFRAGQKNPARIRPNSCAENSADADSTGT